MFYDDIYRVCKEKGTTPTAVLKALDLSTGNISRWKTGSSPSVDIATKMAHHLGVSLSYLCAPEDVVETVFPDDVAEWMEIIKRIPPPRQEMCKDFLRTHMTLPTVPPKYSDKKTA